MVRKMWNNGTERKHKGSEQNESRRGLRLFLFLDFNMERYTGIREPGHNMHIDEMNSRIRIMDDSVDNLHDNIKQH